MSASMCGCIQSTRLLDDPSRGGVSYQILLVTSFPISTLENPKEKNLLSTELKLYVDGFSKPKPSFISYLASI